MRTIRTPAGYHAAEGTDLAQRFGADIRGAAAGLRATSYAPAALPVLGAKADGNPS